MSKRNNEQNQQKPIRTYVLGSGRIAIRPLAALLTCGSVQVIGVGTQPDRRSGRKRRLTPTPVADFASSQGVAVDKPPGANDPACLEHLAEMRPDIVVVASFGQILKKALLDLPPFGCLNIHASLLPRHRGAAPVFATILAGDSVAGVSFMAMDEGLDTGPVYEKHKLDVTGRETRPDLEEKLAELAAHHLPACLHRVCREGLSPRPQDDSRATYAPKIRKQDGEVDWSQPADRIERLVRACQPWPRTFFHVDTGRTSRRIQIVRASVADSPEHDRSPGDVLAADAETGWVIACGRGALRIEQVIPAGRREMAAAEFLRGSPVTTGVRVRGAECRRQGEST